MNVDAVAEAICREDNPKTAAWYTDDDAYEWDIKAMLAGDDGEPYRRMAQAAIDALGGFHCASCDGPCMRRSRLNRPPTARCAIV